MSAIVGRGQNFGLFYISLDTLLWMLTVQGIKWYVNSSPSESQDCSASFISSGYFSWVVIPDPGIKPPGRLPAQWGVCFSLPLPATPPAFA